MTYRSPDLLALVRRLPCVECGRTGTQAAHSNLPEHGKGRSLKASDAAIMALCPECHHALDNGPDYIREDRQRLTQRYIASTYIGLIERGWLAVKPA